MPVTRRNRRGASPSSSPSRPVAEPCASYVRVTAPARLFGPVRRYKVDLDADAEHRWDEVGRDYAGVFQQAIEEIEPFFMEMIGDTVVRVLMVIAGLLVWLGLLPHSGELRGLSRCSGVPVGKLALVQLVYEATSACTSVVVQSSSCGAPVHVRTMDWNMPFDLRAFTIEVEFVRGARPLFVATTWAGFVGIYTGLRIGQPGGEGENKDGGFSLSVNYRLCGNSVRVLPRLTIQPCMTDIYLQF